MHGFFLKKGDKHWYKDGRITENKDLLKVTESYFTQLGLQS